MLHSAKDCILCNNEGGKLIYKNKLFRIVLVDDNSDYRCFVRLILNEHIGELSDLSKEDANAMFVALYQIEKTMRFIVSPDKVNVASLGNVVPHLHWHIIPRFFNDKHFPNPIWGGVVNRDYIPSSELIHNEEALQKSIQVCFSSDV